MRTKSKFITLILSFIPGLSHFYLGFGERGLIYFLITAFTCGGSLAMLILSGSGLFAASLFGGYALIWLISLIDAFNLANRLKYSMQDFNPNNNLDGEEVAKMNKKIITLGLSLIPGAGHMYLGEQKKGLTYMAAFFFTIFFMGWLNLSFLLFLVPLIWFYTFFDAFHIVNGNTVDNMDIDIANLLPRINQEYIGKALILLGLVIILQKIFFPMISFYLNYQIRNYIQTSIISLSFILIGASMLRKKKEIEEDEDDYEDKYED